MKRQSKEEIVQSTMRLPRSLWERINHLAIDKRLSMSQAVVDAVEQYCDRETKKGGR
jgi:predicted transcriptional regulator